MPHPLLRSPRFWPLFATQALGALNDNFFRNALAVLAIRTLLVNKQTTLPVAREIVDVYVRDAVKLPWYIDLLNVTLGTHDLAEAKRRIARLSDAFRADGTRITENLDWAV